MGHFAPQHVKKQYKKMAAVYHAEAQRTSRN